MSAPQIPLCVDMDGTLLRTDTLYESMLAMVRQSPWSLLRLPLWLLRGRAEFKREVAARTQLNVGLLPVHEEFLGWLRQQKQQGRELVLVTAADARIAEAVAEQHPMFDRVLASQQGVNLRSEAKRERLVGLYGENGYDYAGNDHADLPVWRSAREAIVVSRDRRLIAKACSQATVGKTFEVIRPTARDWLQALRVHQWVKNLLVFLPLLLSHQIFAAPLGNALWAFLAFSLCASSVYILNDLLDLEADRQHPRKCRRPFASGRLSLDMGLLAAILLLAAAFIVALQLPPRFIAVLATYYLCTVAYSFHLKRVVLVDVMMLAALYTLRIIAGAAATSTIPSFWLLAFGMSIFLSLGIIKRYTELHLVKLGGGTRAAERGYQADDLPLLRNLGVGAAYGSILVLALYVNSPQSQMMYPKPYWLWLLCPLLLYWISRCWMLTHRGLMHDDPIVFALKDRTSLLVVSLMIGAVLMAS